MKFSVYHYDIVLADGTRKQMVCENGGTKRDAKNSAEHTAKLYGGKSIENFRKVREFVA